MIPKNLKKTVMAGMVAAFCAAPAVSHAYYACQCVTYIKQRPEFKNTALANTKVGTAAKMGNAYFNKWNSGYRKVDLSRELPRNKDVIIFRAYSRVAGIGFGSAGHVGMVATASPSHSGMHLTLISANMNETAGNSIPGKNYRYKPTNLAYSEYSEHGCDNVNAKILTIPKHEYSRIEVYRKK